MCEVNKSYTENVPHQTIAYYTEKVPSDAYASGNGPDAAQAPYTEKECISVPYTENECSQEEIAYSITDKRCYRTGWLQNWSNVECTVHNLDSVGGYFTVYTGFGTDFNQWVTSGSWASFTQTSQSSTAYIYPGSSKTFQYHMQTEAPNTPVICYCNVASLPTKKVCRDVQKFREQCHEVVRYKTLADQGAAKTVTKSRNVTKYSLETKYEVVEEAC